MYQDHFKWSTGVPIKKQMGRKKYFDCNYIYCLMGMCQVTELVYLCNVISTEINSCHSQIATEKDMNKGTEASQ